MKVDQTDVSRLFSLVRILPMVGNPVEENPIDMLVDIVHVALAGFGVTVPREAIDAYACELSGPPLRW